MAGKKVTKQPSELELLRAQLKETNDRTARLEALNYQLMSTNQRQPDPRSQEVEIPDLDLSDLDPTRDNYSVEVTKRINAHTKTVAQAAAVAEATKVARSVQHTNDTTNRVTKLWNDFQEAHPELKGNEDIVELQASGLIREYAQKGIDINAVLASNPNQFLDAVYERSASRLTKLGWKAPADTSTNDRGLPQTLGGEAEEADDDDDDGRAGTLTGGNNFAMQDEPAQQPRGRKAEPSFVTELKAQQKKTGLF